MKNMKVGDKVTFFKPVWGEFEIEENETVYTIVKLDDEWLTLKHPEVGGHFHFRKKNVNRVIPQK